MEKKIISKILMTIRGAFPNFPIVKDVTAPTWELILGEIPEELAMKAVIAYLRTDPSFPPTPGQIYTSCAKILAGPPVPGLTADEAFECLRDLARRFGARARPTAHRILSEHADQRLARIGRGFLDRVIDCEGETARNFAFRDFKAAWESLTQSELTARKDAPLYIDSPVVNGLISQTKMKEISNAN